MLGKKDMKYQIYTLLLKSHIDYPDIELHVAALDKEDAIKHFKKKLGWEWKNVDISKDVYVDDTERVIDKI